MKIKDFNEKVRIGTTVYIGRTKVIIEDINRRTHSAFFKRRGWLRCSEFELQPESRNPVDGKRTRRAHRVMAKFTDDRTWIFFSSREASEAFGISEGRVQAICKNGGQTKDGVRFEYVRLVGDEK